MNQHVSSVRALLERFARRAASDEPEEGLRAIAGLRRELERVEAVQVERALEAGAPWSQIAEALGVTKQAAHKKYADIVKTGEPPPDRERPAKILVTGDARQAVGFAREEASRLSARCVGTEHLLLGILRCSDSTAAQALEAHGVTLEAARGTIQPTLVGLSAEDGPFPRNGSDGRPEISEHAREALEQSLCEAVERDEGYIGVEHLLLALVHDPRNGAARTLDDLEVPPTRIKRELQHKL